MYKESLCNKNALKYKEMESGMKSELRKKNALKYKEMESRKKSELRKKNALKYKEMESGKKSELRKKNVLEYKEMESAKKSELRKKNALDFNEMDPTKKKSLIKKKLLSIVPWILQIKKCFLKTEKTKSVFTNITSFDDKEYICATCHSKRIVFEKIIVMPKGQQKKVAGAICNVPVNCDQTCKVLPRPPERSGIIMLKLKRKLQFRGHNIEQTDVHSITLSENENMEESDDPLNEYRQATNETCLQSVLPDYPVTIQSSERTSLGNEIYDIAPGENRHPVSIMTDQKCEELAFPVLFPRGRFGYMEERNIKLSPKKVADSINIALKKVQGQTFTASQIKSDVNKLKNLVCQDQAYLFLRQIPGTPPYWQKFMYEVVAMVKQLGIPTWFMTLSCADLRWSELFQIVSRTLGKNITEEQVEALSYAERCLMLNTNPVVVAKHFQHRVETFFSKILLSNCNPIGKITYYALRIEFQMRGSPHLHALIWTSDCPKLATETKGSYIEFIDKNVQANLPDEHAEPELHQLVKMYQKHNHSKTCRKYKNVSCCFNFGQFLAKQTIVPEQLDENLDDQIKSSILSRRKEVLSLVKQKIDKMLNPSKDGYDSTLIQADVLTVAGVTEDQYYSALSISPDSDFDLHLKRPVDSCFINNYFVAGLKGFGANVDLQPVFNHYKCITYVCSYFTKDEKECSQAIYNAAKEAKSSNMNIRDGLKRIGAAFLSTREVSSQECVYRCMPELWLRKIFPKTVFVNTNLPEKRACVTKTPDELNELDDDSTDIYKSNIIERYTLRPNSIPAVNKLCLAQFAASYYKDYKTDL
ncbi:Hypothetical predicted protein [Paramuricea clavata]|uniref:Helitron helicase-like domain-containing protein n=1 Tax=Paramuricea clavata TaxID=317549 RepID=A0A6S7GQ89_PARCT|nr:Hypothetical predicted protein [Paramuricea clavata]